MWLAACVHVLAGEQIRQRLVSPHVLGERHQQFLVATSASNDMRDMGFNDGSQPGLVLGQQHRSSLPTYKV
jgi:hypothetical protein